MKKQKIFIVLLITFIVTGFTFISLAEEKIPKEKRTVLGLYINAKTAFEKWNKNPEKIKILDVRTPGEYIFVGHAPMAHNIPIKFLKPVLRDGRPHMSSNRNFVDEVKKKFKETDTIMVMSRSGARSALAINKLADADFKNVYNITDGFEGEKLNIPGCYKNGKRLVNGWKNSSAPWTYNVDTKLMYIR